LAKLAGGEAPNDRVIDGHDIWPIMAGQAGAKSPHEFYYYYKGQRLESIRSGPWKLRRLGKTKKAAASVELYHLENDIGEMTNLSEKHPEKAQALLAQMETFDASLKAAIRPAGKH
jgi:arylsulfatase A